MKEREGEEGKKREKRKGGKKEKGERAEREGDRRERNGKETDKVKHFHPSLAAFQDIVLSHMGKKCYNHF